jgi:hypothetical protein
MKALIICVFLAFSTIYAVPLSMPLLFSSGAYSGSCPEVVQSPSGQVSINPSASPSCIPLLGNEARNLMSGNFSQAAQIALSQVPTGYELNTVGLCGPSQSLDYCVYLIDYTGSFNATIQGQTVKLGYSIYQVEIDQSMHVIALQGPFRQLNYWGTTDSAQVADSPSSNTWGGSCTPNSNTACPWSGYEARPCNWDVFGSCWSIGDPKGAELETQYRSISVPQNPIQYYCCEMGPWAGVAVNGGQVGLQVGLVQANDYVSSELGYSNGHFWEVAGNSPVQGSDPPSCVPSPGDLVFMYVWLSGTWYVDSWDLTKGNCWIINVAGTSYNQTPQWSQAILETPTFCINGVCAQTQWPEFAYSTKYGENAFILNKNGNWVGFNTNANPYFADTAQTTTSCPGGAQTNVQPSGFYNGSNFQQDWLTSEYC